MCGIESSRWIEWAPDRLELGEGGRWFDGQFYMVDLLAGRLLVVSGEGPGELVELFRVDHPLGAVAPVAGRPGQWIAAVGKGIAIVAGDGGCQWLARPELNNPVPTRMNDGVADCFGRFWAGSMGTDGTPRAGSLYRVDVDGRVTRVVEALSLANGPAFSSDGVTMYLADSDLGEIDRFELEPVTGSIRRREEFVRVDPEFGSPDGMTVDDDDHLWVAMWGAGEVHRYSATGSLDRVIAIPASQPTSVCFGGPMGRRLFVTTAYENLAAPQQYDGGLYAIDLDVSGPASPFAKLG